MSAPRDHSVDGRSRPGTASARPVRDPTESLAPFEPGDAAPPLDDLAGDPDLPDDDGDDDELDPLSMSRAPLGTRDRRARDDATRVESPAARNRTPAPPAPADVPASDRRPRSDRRAQRPSKPPRGPSERPEERLDSVLGSYRILELLGKGGMGFVYKAEHVKLGRLVALKLLRADYARRRDSVARFVREAQTVNKIRHRNIVDVPDIVELDDGTTFIVMELLEGQSLGKWARAGFSIPRALALLIQICDGLAAAHAVGVIHRDLKPDNVFVVPTGDGAEVVKLLDFGVAKLLNRDDEDVGLETQAGSVIGTPAYMSPEQAGGTTVDARSDIYSLGAIMYELFTGQPVFKGRSFGEYVRKHLGDLPVPPRRTPGGAALDERLEAVILRCLEKDPARRYSHLGALRDELLHLLGGIETAVGMVRDLGSTDSLSSRDLLSGSSARSVRASGVASHAPGPGHAPGLGHAPAPMPLPAAYAAPRARRWPWLVLGGAALAAAGAAVAIAVGGGDPPAPPPAPARAPEPAAAAPRIEPLAAPAAAPSADRRRVIEVRIDATPGGDVYPAGSTMRRCATPCTVAIDPGDGGSPIERDFLIRRAGYRDELVRIDLANPPPAVAVELTPEGGRRDRRDGRPDARTDARTDARPERPDPPPDARPDPKPDPKPDRKPDRPEKVDKIDRTDTLDPFR